MPSNKEVKLVYGKPEIDPSTQEFVRDETTGKLHYILYGSKEKFPTDTDEPLVYKNDEDTVIDDIADYKYFYNKNSGVFAGKSVRQIPNSEEDTAANSFLEDGTPVITTTEYAPVYVLSTSITGGTVNPTTASVKDGESSEFEVTTDAISFTATSTVGTVEISENVVTVSNVTSDGTVTITCGE